MLFRRRYNFPYQNAGVLSEWAAFVPIDRADPRAAGQLYIKSRRSREKKLEFVSRLLIMVIEIKPLIINSKKPAVKIGRRQISGTVASLPDYAYIVSRIIRNEKNLLLTAHYFPWFYPM